MQFATRRKHCTGLLCRQKQKRLNGRAELNSCAAKPRQGAHNLNNRYLQLNKSMDLFNDAFGVVD